MVCEGTSVRTYLGHSSNLVTVSVSAVHFYVYVDENSVFSSSTENGYFLCYGSFCCSDCWDVSLCQFWLSSYWCIISFGPLVTFSAMWKKFDIPDRDLRVLYVVTFITMEFI